MGLRDREGLAAPRAEWTGAPIAISLWGMKHAGIQILLLVVVVVSLAACRPDASNDTGANNESEPASAATSVEIVGKRYDVNVGDAGYVPNRLEMKVGEPATLVFTRTTESQCGEAVVIPSLDLQRDLPVGQPVAIPFTPTKTGEVAFACGMNMMKGAIIVVE